MSNNNELRVHWSVGGQPACDSSPRRNGTRKRYALLADHPEDVTCLQCLKRRDREHGVDAETVEADRAAIAYFKSGHRGVPDNG